MYNVIVVGTDGSDRATVAVRHAFALAKMAGGKIHAVQVVHPAVKTGFADTSGGQLEVDKMREYAERSGATLLADAERECVSIEIHNPAMEDVADALIRIAEDVGADLIVVGNRGMSGMSRFMLGSVPNKVSHHCPCNLLIVNTEAS
jgi:nucleotide-binding universal stress UspA family protein